MAYNAEQILLETGRNIVLILCSHIKIIHETVVSFDKECIDRSEIQESIV